MRVVRVLVFAIAAVVVAGAIASASQPLSAGFDGEPTPAVSETPEPSLTPEAEESPEAESVEAPSPEAQETETADTDDDAAEQDASTAPNFAGCEGLRGLENAICRHVALLEVHPDDLGLQNALTHLEENLAAQQGAAEASAGEADCPGKSCESHGNGDEHGNGHGDAG